MQSVYFQRHLFLNWLQIRKSGSRNCTSSWSLLIISFLKIIHKLLYEMKKNTEMRTFMLVRNISNVVE